jgi:signal transduction histidine kinase
MDRETQEKIFTPFFSSKGRKGTGLGLFVSNTIIQQHGGKISVKSTPGYGALFRIEIPKILPVSLKDADNDAEAR